MDNSPSMHANMSPPVQVAYAPATELGDSGINSNGGHHIPHVVAAPVPPPVKPRYPLVPPATGTKRMRPWDTMTTSEAITTHLSKREALPPDSESPALTQESPTTDASARLQSTTCEILGCLEDALEKTAAAKLHNLPGPHLSERWRDPKDTASQRTTRSRRRR